MSIKPIAISGLVRLQTDSKQRSAAKVLSPRAIYRCGLMKKRGRTTLTGSGEGSDVALAICDRSRHGGSESISRAFVSGDALLKAHKLNHGLNWLSVAHLPIANSVPSAFTIGLSACCQPMRAVESEARSDT